MKEKNALQSSWAAAFTVASVWFGTHVGGGFASGNQVIQYFANYGTYAAFFPIITMGILSLIMYIMVKFAYLNGFDNYKDTYRALYPKPWMEVFFEIFYMVIVLAAIASAVAGAGEVVANFLGLPYVGFNKMIMNLMIVVILILLTIFGVKLVIAASTLLSIAIIITTLVMVVAGLSANIDAFTQKTIEEYGIELASFKHNVPESVWRGIIVYAAFQCVSIPPLIAASKGMNLQGIKRAQILGWLMNGIALSASAFMLSRWYPLLAAMQSKGKELLAADPNSTEAIVKYASALGIPNQTVLAIVGIKWLLVAFSILLFCAFMSTCVTLIYTMVQRFQGKCFPSVIKNEKLRGVIVAAIMIAVCFAISLLGLSSIVKYAYGYDGYYALLVIVIPALIWGIPKNRKLMAERKASLNE